MSANVETTHSLSPEQIHTLRQAKERARKLERIASIASFNGFTTALFAAISAIILLASFSWDAAGITLALAIVSFNE